MAKAKGGTGRGTGKKGWTRWQKAENKKNAPKIFGLKKGAKGAAGAKGAVAAKSKPSASDQ